MQVLSIDLEKGCGIRKESATGVRIFAGRMFLSEMAMQSEASSEDGCVEAKEIFEAGMHISETRYRPGKVGYSVDLSEGAARYLLGSLDTYADIWGDWGFEYASMVRSANALERHLTKYGLTATSGQFTR